MWRWIGKNDFKRGHAMKKAYQVMIDQYEEYSVVVFASNSNQAKLLAMKSENFNIRYIDLRPIRMPQADYFAKEDPDILRLDFNNPEHKKFLLKEGWYINSN